MLEYISVCNKQLLIAKAELLESLHSFVTVLDMVLADREILQTYSPKLLDQVS